MWRRGRRGRRGGGGRGKQGGEHLQLKAQLQGGELLERAELLIEVLDSQLG